LLSPTHLSGVSRFHWVRLRIITKITGTTRNTTTPIRLGARKPNAVRTRRRSSAVAGTVAVFSCFGTNAGAAATLIVPPMDSAARAGRHVAVPFRYA
jgi:hypothetical protein